MGSRRTKCSGCTHRKPPNMRSEDCPHAIIDRRGTICGCKLGKWHVGVKVGERTKALYDLERLSAAIRENHEWKVLLRNMRTKDKQTAIDTLQRGA